MTDAESNLIKELFTRYRNVVVANMPALSEMPDKCDGSHLVDLCDEALENHLKYPFDKLCRWMGFVQGVLAAKGLIDVDTERNFSRPALHALHADPIPTFP